MPDVPPSELAWRYLLETQRLVCGNDARNTVRRADFSVTLQSVRADCMYLAPPGRNSAAEVDARIWMWEAWWQGNPYLNIEQYFRDTVFGRRTNDDASYDRAVASVLDAATAVPFAIVQTSARDAARFERLMKATRRRIEIVAPNADETYIIAE